MCVDESMSLYADILNRLSWQTWAKYQHNTDYVWVKFMCEPKSIGTFVLVFYIIYIIWLFISIGARVFDVLCARWVCDSIGNRSIVTVSKF